MKNQELLSKLVLETIAYGSLELEEDGKWVNFRLLSEDCLVTGKLQFFRGFSSKFDPPYFEPLMLDFSFKIAGVFFSSPFNPPSHLVETADLLLARRLTPETLNTFDKEQGWVLTTSVVEPICDTDLQQFALLDG